MNRDIKHLLNTYYYRDKRTERLAPGELWSTDHAVKNMKDQRTYERYNKMETIINERTTKSRGTFTLPLGQKDRVRHLIKHLDFYLGRTTETQYITMIIIYVKLESNNKYTFNQFLPFLTDYGIDVQTFVRFLVKLNVYHLEN